MAIFDTYVSRPRYEWCYAVQWKGDNRQECLDFLVEYWDEKASVDTSYWERTVLAILDERGIEFGKLFRGHYIVKYPDRTGISLEVREIFEPNFMKKD